MSHHVIQAEAVAAVVVASDLVIAMVEPVAFKAACALVAFCFTLRFACAELGDDLWAP